MTKSVGSINDCTSELSMAIASSPAAGWHWRRRVLQYARGGIKRGVNQSESQRRRRRISVVRKSLGGVAQR